MTATTTAAAPDEQHVSDCLTSLFDLENVYDVPNLVEAVAQLVDFCTCADDPAGCAGCQIKQRLASITIVNHRYVFEEPQDRVGLALYDLFEALFDLRTKNGVLMTVEALAQLLVDRDRHCVCPDGPDDCIRCAVRRRIGLPADSTPVRRAW
jgi:hypothetical protein